nr:MAG TPA: hypothetical protein [Caudoviricetes sp.]
MVTILFIYCITSNQYKSNLVAQCIVLIISHQT